MDTIGPVPRQQFFGNLSDAVQAVNDFGSKPFGYDNPPVHQRLRL
jgi:hypothetical protein